MLKAESEKRKFQNQSLPVRILLLILVYFIVVFLSSCSKEKGELKEGFEAGQYRTIVAFGDSIVEGYRQLEGWPELLARDLSTDYEGIRIINAGVSGDMASDGFARLKESVLDEGPDLVLISFGLNDMKNGRPVDAFESDLENMVDNITDSGARPVLLTTTRLQKGTGIVARISPEPFNEAIRRVASKKTVTLIDVNERFRGYNTARYLMDVAHPNMEGYEVLADIVKEGLVGER